MDQMGGGMVSLSVLPRRGIHRHVQLFTLANPPSRDSPLMQNQGRHRSRRLLELNPPLRPNQYTLVTNLTTTFRIERSHVYYQFDYVPFNCFPHKTIVF